jgi:D-alanyl-D-alanine carboxypeptidase/D-alanyl-D-alanine-endopeptidase (penicillin-binding protein 4)
LVFTGVFPRNCGEKSKSFSLLSPNEYAYALFQQLWRELGGTLSGRARS